MLLELPWFYLNPTDGVDPDEEDEEEEEDEDEEEPEDDEEEGTWRVWERA